jgi:AraC-like DNA-binding protein
LHEEWRALIWKRRIQVSSPDGWALLRANIASHFRLHEARRILLMDSLDIGEASFRVGYQSRSQFSKDYRQYFGRLPKDDVVAHAEGGIPFAAYSREVSVR